ncbi:hypothetical protein [Kineosporia sp. NBRC 101731]|uniref:hypothetical protein n=1 Tax=Kineosporia sp. NBRC 101731 TaxID=3032199 RepID=UPI0024A23D29|nr:hypothetical protein [Kineosporia sp. NBRC 101731]GLY32075.1 hypothetical protein Kisp02_54400 [Kineosporia sp. NBRC 101731]
MFARNQATAGREMREGLADMPEPTTVTVEISVTHTGRFGAPTNRVSKQERDYVDEHPVTTYRRLIAEHLPRIEQSLIAIHGDPDEVQKAAG